MSCARKACKARNADWVHADTGLHYCGRCARKINEHAGRELVRLPRWNVGDVIQHRRGGYRRVILAVQRRGYLWGYPAPLACEYVYDSRNSTDPELRAPWEGGYELVASGYVEFAEAMLRGVS